MDTYERFLELNHYAMRCTTSYIAFISGVHSDPRLRLYVLWRCRERKGRRRRQSMEMFRFPIKKKKKETRQKTTAPFGREELKKKNKKSRVRAVTKSLL